MIHKKEVATMLHKSGDLSLLRENLRNAKKLYGDLSEHQQSSLRDLTVALRLSVRRGELQYINRQWYVSHAGLLRIAQRRRCFGIDTSVESHLTDASNGRWVFRATVHKSASKCFTGYGDADPTNVSSLV